MDVELKRTLASFDLAPTSVVVRVCVSVALSILDAYVRRNDGQERVMGTLLGNITEGQVVDVSDCFINKHKFNQMGAVVVDAEYHRQVLELKNKSNNKEVVVGWFSTGSQLNLGCAFVHQFFSCKDSQFVLNTTLPSPICLLVDPQLKQNLTMKAYMSIPIPIIIGEAVMHFTEIPVCAYLDGSEKPTVSMLLKALGDDNADDAQEENKYSFATALHDLENLIKRVQAYVQDVLDGNVERNAAIGRQLFSLLCCDPIDSSTIDSVCLEKQSDLLMSKYLSDALKVQMVLADKICAISNPPMSD